jgi:hypothetical protein
MFSLFLEYTFIVEGSLGFKITSDMRITALYMKYKKEVIMKLIFKLKDYFNPISWITIS